MPHRKHPIMMAFILASALFLASSGAGANETKGTLATLVQQLQNNPSDTALRERIIKQARQMRHPPAIPEQARRYFIVGETIVKSAKSPAEEAPAVDSFQKALAIAPWWADAYYDLATAQELAGSYDDAQASLELYILTGPDAKDARAAQDRIYVIDGEKKVAQAAAANSPAAQEAQQEAQQKAENDSFMQSIEGAYFLCYDGFAAPARDGSEYEKYRAYFQIQGGVASYYEKPYWLSDAARAFYGNSPAQLPAHVDAGIPWIHEIYGPIVDRKVQSPANPDGLYGTLEFAPDGNSATYVGPGMTGSEQCTRHAPL